jgi:hypothetical protein
MTEMQNTEQGNDMAAERQTAPPAPQGPQFPAGTPEYDLYVAKLKVELAKFARGQHPYPHDQATAPRAMTVRELAALLKVLLDEGFGGLRIVTSLFADSDELSHDARREVDSWDWGVVDLEIAGELPDVWLDLAARPVRGL